MAGKKKTVKKVAKETVENINYDATETLVQDAKEQEMSEADYINMLDTTEPEKLNRQDAIFYIQILRQRCNNLDSMIQSAFKQSRALNEKSSKVNARVLTQVDFVVNSIANLYGTAMLVKKDLRGEIENGN